MSNSSDEGSYSSEESVDPWGDTVSSVIDYK